jgi:hypothetical protein
LDRTLRRRARALGRRLIDTLGAGWGSGNVDLLSSIFAADAVFLETAFSSPINGLDAIRSYWGDVPYHQSEVSFSSGEVFGAGPWFAAEFKCSFRRRRSWVFAAAIEPHADRSQILEALRPRRIVCDPQGSRGHQIPPPVP